MTTNVWSEFYFSKIIWFTAIYSHGRMVKAGAEADLHVWDGLFHGFFMNPAVPESRDAFDVMIKFFGKHLAR